MFKCALVAVCLAPAITLAASFDCSKAHSPLEVTVCADPKLSALDSAIAASYHSAMQRLSPAGQGLLRSGQRQWLTFVSQVCIRPAADDNAAACLAQSYHERLDDLAGAAVVAGPYVFSRSETYSASDHDESGRPYQIHISTLRIDQPSTPKTAQWNARMASKANAAAESGCDARHGDQVFDADVIYASLRAISVRITTGEYCHGTPHGHGGTNSVTDVTEPRIRPLETQDLFKPGSGWEVFLAQRSYQAIVSTAQGSNVDEQHVGTVAVDLRRWTLTQDGLLITFDPDGGLGYAQGATEVVISWRDLAAYLVPDAPVGPLTQRGG